MTDANEARILVVTTDDQQFALLGDHLTTWQVAFDRATSVSATLNLLKGAQDAGLSYAGVIVDAISVPIRLEDFPCLLRAELGACPASLVLLTVAVSDLSTKEHLAAGFTAVLGRRPDKTALFHALHRTEATPAAGNVVSVSRYARHPVREKGRRPRVLIVSRSSVSQRILAELVTQDGATPHIFDSSDTALAELIKADYDAALFVECPPWVDSIAAWKECQFTQAPGQLKLMVLLEPDDRIAIHECESAGIHYCIMKNPRDWKDIKNTIHDLLTRPPAGDPAPA